MANYCLLTGTELTENQVTPIKKMCLNCKSCTEVAPNSYACSNEAVMEKGKEKILAAVPEGFEIDTLTLKPMALKNPTKKCGNYDADKEAIYNEIDGIFGLN